MIENGKTASQLTSPDLPRLIAVQLLSGIIYTIKNYEDKETRENLICDLLLLYIAGFMKIMIG